MNKYILSDADDKGEILQEFPKILRMTNALDRDIHSDSLFSVAMKFFFEASTLRLVSHAS